MDTVEDVKFYFYIACGVTAAILLIIVILIIILFVKVNLLTSDSSNQLSRQANMMADFCYTNPTIVPGEELSRRGFSMYRGSDHTAATDTFGWKNNYSSYEVARPKF